MNDLKREVTFRPRCRLRQAKFLNNIVEQDHRNVKRRTWLAKGYGSVSTWRTLRGIAAMDMIRKGIARRVAKSDTVAQLKFVERLCCKDLRRARSNLKSEVIVRVQAGTPKSLSTNWICRRTSLPATHRTCPFRII